jgi:hypothetical protein
MGITDCAPRHLMSAFVLHVPGVEGVGLVRRHPLLASRTDNLLRHSPRVGYYPRRLERRAGRR